MALGDAQAPGECVTENNFTNNFQTVEQNKGNKFLVMSSMYLYPNESWTTTNHSVRSVHITV